MFILCFKLSINTIRSADYVFAVYNVILKDRAVSKQAFNRLSNRSSKETSK